MIVDVFVAERDGVNSLGDQVGLRMRDENRMPWVANDLIDSFDEFDFLIDRLEQENPRVGGAASALEVDVDFLILATPARVGLAANFEGVFSVVPAVNSGDSCYTVFRSFVVEMCCNLLATCLIAPFYHNDLFKKIRPA